jgi:hypothetical protein
MKKKALRYRGILTSLVAPLLLLHCTDDTQVCSAQAAEDGTETTVCKTISDVGQSTLALRTPESAGDHCPYGGERIDTGFDLNGNLQLDPTEVDISAYVCDGAPGSNGAEGASGATGPSGAMGPSGATGPSTVPSLVAMEAENAGDHCTNGGAAIHYGTDTNNNGVLDEAEVVGTKYVCAGTPGANGDRGFTGDAGRNGHNSLVHVTTFDGTDGDCEAGGLRIEVGIDDGGSSDTANDGTLGESEVNGDETELFCNAIGATGATGIGATGATGAQGSDGATGATGAIGATGSQGDIGPQGVQGFQGDVGAQGPQGFQGAVGAQGFQGVQGAQGFQGDLGAQGAQGFQGVQGAQGFQGDTGAQGPQGSQGDVGAQGPQGSQGDVGAQGAQGFQGDVGAQGPQGFQGVQGVQGPQGDTGSQGPQGTQGTQGPQGDTGTQGPQGTQGSTGAAAVMLLEPQTERLV